jgi:hypothetical protein
MTLSKQNRLFKERARLLARLEILDTEREAVQGKLSEIESKLRIDDPPPSLHLHRSISSKALDQRAERYGVPMIRKNEHGSLTVVGGDKFKEINWADDEDPVRSFANIVAQATPSQKTTNIPSSPSSPPFPPTPLPFKGAAATTAMNELAKKYNVRVVRRAKDGSLTVQGGGGVYSKNTRDPTAELAHLLEEAQVKALSVSIPTRHGHGHGSAQKLEELSPEELSPEARALQRQTRTAAALAASAAKRRQMQKQQARTAAALAAQSAMDRRAERYGVPRVRRDGRGSLTVVQGSGSGSGSGSGAKSSSGGAKSATSKGRGSSAQQVDPARELANLIHAAQSHGASRGESSNQNRNQSGGVGGGEAGDAGGAPGVGEVDDNWIILESGPEGADANAAVAVAVPGSSHASAVPFRGTAACTATLRRAEKYNIPGTCTLESA